MLDKDFIVPIITRCNFSQVICNKDNLELMMLIVSKFTSLDYDKVKETLEYYKHEKGYLDIKDYIDDKITIITYDSNRLKIQFYPWLFTSLKYILKERLNVYSDYYFRNVDINASLNLDFDPFYVNDKRKKAIDAVGISMEFEDYKLENVAPYNIFINFIECYRLWITKEYLSNKYNWREKELIILIAMLTTNSFKEFKECLNDIYLDSSIKEKIINYIVEINKDKDNLEKYSQECKEDLDYEQLINLCRDNQVEELDRITHEERTKRMPSEVPNGTDYYTGNFKLVERNIK